MVAQTAWPVSTDLRMQEDMDGPVSRRDERLGGRVR